MCSLASIAVVAIALAACGGGSQRAEPVAPALGPAPTTIAEQILGLLPAGPQVVVEIDLARLRGNPVVGRLVTAALAGDATNTLVPDAAGTPLADADLVVLAAYGVGTAEAATVSVLAGPRPIANTTRIAEGLYAVGPADWVAQLEQRAAITADAPVAAPADFLALRDKAMPPKAPGASLRITAQLSFDARVALARQVGLENAPAQLSVWGDVVDDLAIIVDADASDPGETADAKASVARLEATVRGALRELAATTEMTALGLPSSLTRAKLVVRGTWIRTIVAVGPNHLARVVERAEKLMALAEPAPPPETP